MQDPGEKAWEDLGALVRETDAKGQTTEWFCKRWLPLVERYGWSDWIDPTNKFAFRRRAMGVLRCHSTNVYMAHRYRQLGDGQFSVWVYMAESDPRFCPAEHHLLDRVALPVEHPFWSVWAPPNAFGCVCQVHGARSLEGVRRLRGDPEKPLPEWWSDGSRGPDPYYLGNQRPDLRRIVAEALADRLPW